MKVIQTVNIKDIENIFGSPGDTSRFVKLPFPFPLKASWDRSLIIHNFYGHEFIGESVIQALEEILKEYGLEEVQGSSFDIYGGCYANRMTVTGKRKSIHAWGLAVDYLPHLGGYNKPCYIPYHIVEAFKKRGFVWGGDWGIKDGMHFSAIIE